MDEKIKSRDMSKRNLMMAMTFVVLLPACSNTNFGSSESRYSSAESKLEGMRAELINNPDNVDLLNNIGHQNARLARWDESLGSYNEALLVNNNNREAILGFARGQLAVGGYTKAIEHADIILNRNEADIPALLLKAGALAGLKRYDESRQILQFAMSAAPRDLDVRSNLALVDALAGNNDHAYNLAKQAAFAPDADIRHKRNFILVAGITGNVAAGKSDAQYLGIAPGDIDPLIKLGQRARERGFEVFGIAPVA